MRMFRTKRSVQNQMPYRTLALLVLSFCLFACQNKTLAESEPAAGSIVQVIKTDEGWQLTCNNEPYFVKGAGGTEHFEVLVKAGGNSVRTWGVEQAEAIFDQAHEMGLSVTVGIWFGHERHGFDYSDKQAVARQKELALQFIRKYKDHPAVLMWSLGNEAEGEGNNPLIWQAINDAAKAAKQIDPNHPVMTVTAEAAANKIENLKKYCPDVDILGINCYGGFPSLAQRLADAGLDRPYIVAEYGPLGQWEVSQTPWGAPNEQTSTEKAKFCSDGYRSTILNDRRNCLGGYLFHWGSKQEVTPTWYGVFIRDTNETTEVVDAVSKYWTGNWPKNRAPSIKPIEFKSVDTNAIKKNAICHASVRANDPDKDTLTYEWVIQSESTDRRTGGDEEAVPPAHPELIQATRGATVTFRAPAEAGAYRLYVYVRDNQGHAATANSPFQVTD